MHLDADEDLKGVGLRKRLVEGLRLYYQWQRLRHKGSTAGQPEESRSHL